MIINQNLNGLGSVINEANKLLGDTKTSSSNQISQSSSIKQISENPGGVIISLTKDMDMTELENQLLRRFSRCSLSELDLMIIKDGELHKYLKYKK